MYCRYSCLLDTPYHQTISNLSIFLYGNNVSNKGPGYEPDPPSYIMYTVTSRKSSPRTQDGRRRPQGLKNLVWINRFPVSSERSLRDHNGGSGSFVVNVAIVPMLLLQRPQTHRHPALVQAVKTQARWIGLDAQNIFLHISVAEAKLHSINNE